MLCMQPPQQGSRSARRLLQEAVIYGTAAAPSSLLAAGGIPIAGIHPRFPQASPYNASHFSPSVVIIMVVLLSAFFFMGFFSLYVRRCADGSSSNGRTSLRSGGEYQEHPNQGLDPEILHTLPLVTYSSAKKKGNNVECVVCLTEFEEQEPLRQLPTCKHVFHQECIDMWLFSHSTCPLCRRGIAARAGSLSFRWGSGSFRHLAFLSRGGSAAQNLPSAEDMGTISLIESNRSDTMASIRRSSSTEMTSASGRQPSAPAGINFDGGGNAHTAGSRSNAWKQAGKVQYGTNSALHETYCTRWARGLHLGRANSTGHSLLLGLANEANAPDMQLSTMGSTPAASGLYRSISEMPEVGVPQSGLFRSISEMPEQYQRDY